MSSEIQARGPCDQVEPLLEDLIDGQLTESEQRRVGSHLADCEDCAARLASLHNLAHYFSLLGEARSAISEGRFKAFYEERVAVLEAFEGGAQAG